MRKVKFGIIGCGRIVSKHLQALKDLAHAAEIVAVCDIDTKRLKKIATEFGVRAYSNYKEMITQEKLDVLSILTWSGNHAQIALECMPYVSNLVLEKPMALSLSEADKLIQACKQAQVRLFVVKQNRYNPPIVALKKAVDSGRFGRLLLGTVRVRWARPAEYYQQDSWRGTWNLDGGVLTNQASHHIDLLTWIFGPVKSVFAKTATFLAPIEAEDTGVALVQFKSGAIGVIEATTCARPKDLEGSISVLGEKGAVEIGGFAVNSVKNWKFVDPSPEDLEVSKLSTQPQDVYGFGHFDFMKDVVHCIQLDRPSMIDGIEGRRSLELIHAIYESAELGREVSLQDFVPQRSRLGGLNGVNTTHGS